MGENNRRGRLFVIGLVAVVLGLALGATWSIVGVASDTERQVSSEARESAAAGREETVTTVVTIHSTTTVPSGEDD